MTVIFCLIPVLLLLIAVEIFVFSRRIERHLNILKIGPTQEGQFKCYYCGGWFPLAAEEVICGYSYCPDHGMKRKEIA